MRAPVLSQANRVIGLLRGPLRAQRRAGGTSSATRGAVIPRIEPAHRHSVHSYTSALSASTTGQDASQTFAALEQAAWSEPTVSAAYTKGWYALTAQTVPTLLDAAAAPQAAPVGTSILDVCTGPGVAARGAALRGCSVVAADFSPPFLAECAARCAGLDVTPVEANAQELEALRPLYPRFSAVVCNYGVLHLPEPAKFFAGALGALKPGGRLAFSVWLPPPRNEGFEVVLSAVRECGDPDLPLPEGPPFFQYAEPEPATAALRAAGFVDIRFETVEQTLVIESETDLFEMVLDGTARTRALLCGQTPSDLAAIRDRVATDVAARFATKAGFEISMPAAVVSGAAPRL